MSHDGVRCATAGNSSGDNTVRVWSLVSGQQVRCLEQMAQEGRTPLAFDLQGRVLIGIGRAVHVIEPRSGRQVACREVDGDVSSVASAAEAPVTVIGTVEGMLHQWDGDRLTLSIRIGRQVLGVAVSADGGHVAVLTDESLVVPDRDGRRSERWRCPTTGDGIRAATAFHLT